MVEIPPQRLEARSVRPLDLLTGGGEGGRRHQESFFRSEDRPGVGHGGGGTGELFSTGGLGPNSEIFGRFQGLCGAQANDVCCLRFDGKYVSYPRFRQEWWTCWGTYYGHVCNGLACRVLQEIERRQSTVHVGEHRRPHRTVTDTGRMLRQARKVFG